MVNFIDCTLCTCVYKKYHNAEVLLQLWYSTVQSVEEKNEVRKKSRQKSKLEN